MLGVAGLQGLESEMQRNLMTKPSTSPMKADGERMVPESCAPSTFWEHVHRYQMAIRYVRGMDVLDIACGEGYGTASIKASGAKSVLGVDIDPDAVAHAAQRYGVTTRQGSATSIPCPDQSFDLVVSFETIEHVDSPERFLDEVCRVLRPNGTFIVSTPDKEVYRDVDPNNTFHISEMTPSEFKKLLSGRFRSIKFGYQTPRRSSLLSLSVLAAEESPLKKIRGSRRGVRLLRSWFSPHIIKDELLSAARMDPVQTILSNVVPGHGWLNPYVVRGPLTAYGTDSTYIVAVCQR